MNPSNYSNESLYVLALCLVATADSDVSTEESEHLHKISSTMGVNPEECNNLLRQAQDNRNCVKLLANISHHKELSRRIYRDCLLIANTDNNICGKERISIESIRLNLKISDSLSIKFDEWIELGMEWQKKGDQLIKEG